MPSIMALIDYTEMARWRLWSLLIFFVVPQALPIGVGLLSPGRKGRMLTSRTADWNGVSFEEGWSELLARLEKERFVIQQTSVPGRLTAMLPKADKSRIATHSDKPLAGDFEMQKDGAGVKINATISMPDLVFKDTGEGAHIDQVLDNIMSLDPATRCTVRKRFKRDR